MPETPQRVLMIDDDRVIGRLVNTWLAADGVTVDLVADGAHVAEAVTRAAYDAVLLDVHLPGTDGMTLLRRLRRTHPRVPVVMLTAEADPTKIVEAMQLGAFDYMVKPIEPRRLRTVARNAIERARMTMRLAHLERQLTARGYAGIIGMSAPMRELYRQLERLVSSDVSVLVHGESGTGKELVARAVHDHCGRSDGPFVALNCAAIPETLQESELFGHERGAFTGATARRQGRFEQADGGTLFLDEVAELSPTVQARLLRVLQERRFYRVGGSDKIRSDFRLIAASHRDLLAEVRAGRFREDLYFRVAVYELEVPPLRRRGDDLIELARHFLDQYADGRPLEFADGVVDRMRTYRWPGNVRELQNAMQRASVSARDGVVRIDDLPRALRTARQGFESGRFAVAPVARTTPPPSPAPAQGIRPLAEVERDAILEAVARTDGNLSRACRALGIGRTTLYRKLEQYRAEGVAIPGDA